MFSGPTVCSVGLPRNRSPARGSSDFPGGERRIRSGMRPLHQAADEPSTVRDLDLQPVGYALIGAAQVRASPRSRRSPDRWRIFAFATGERRQQHGGSPLSVRIYGQCIAGISVASNDVKSRRAPKTPDTGGPMRTYRSGDSWTDAHLVRAEERMAEACAFVARRALLREAWPPRRPARAWLGSILLAAGHRLLRTAPGTVAPA